MLNVLMHFKLLTYIATQWYYMHVTECGNTHTIILNKSNTLPFTLYSKKTPTFKLPSTFNKCK